MAFAKTVELAPSAIRRDRALLREMLRWALVAGVSVCVLACEEIASVDESRIPTAASDGAVQDADSGDAADALQGDASGPKDSSAQGRDDVDGDQKARP